MKEEKDDNNMDMDSSIREEASGCNAHDKCHAERNEYLAGWQRAKADLINYKRDELKRLEDAAKYQLEDVIYDLVSVLDNFDLAISAMEKQGQVEKGIYLIRTQLEDSLKRRGLTKINVSSGMDFDPTIMEAVAMIESEGPPDKVVEVIEIGYKMHEKLLRPVRVRVSKEKN